MNDAFGIIVIGDEILNGRRRDRHFDAIGGMLRERGFAVAWLRVLPDDPDYLAAEFTRTMAEGVPVFCCGGIGATPDDHTRGCAARAAGVPLEMHPDAVAEIEARFGGLSRNQLPHVVATAPQLARLALRYPFETGLERILDSLDPATARST